MDDVVRLEMELVRRLQRDLDDQQREIIALRKEIDLLRTSCVELVLRDIQHAFARLPEVVKYKLGVLRQQDKIQDRIGLG
jgi:hypothetical protein